MTPPLTNTQRVIRAHLAQLALGDVYEYEYRLDPIDPQAIQVRRNVSGANWCAWGEFDTWRSTEIALAALQMAQECQSIERETEAEYVSEC